MVLVLTLDPAQLAPQILAVGRQAAVVLQQFGVLLDEARRHLLLPLLLLQLRLELLSEQKQSEPAAARRTSHSPHTLAVY